MGADDMTKKFIMSSFTDQEEAEDDSLKTMRRTKSSRESADEKQWLEEKRNSFRQEKIFKASRQITYYVQQQMC
jgi:hypothetical protein